MNTVERNKEEYYVLRAVDLYIVYEPDIFTQTLNLSQAIQNPSARSSLV